MEALTSDLVRAMEMVQKIIAAALAQARTEEREACAVEEFDQEFDLPVERP